MAKKFTFQGVEIPVAVYRGEYFFLRKDVTAALGYSNSMPLPEGAEVIEVGANSYVSLSDLRRACASATGERKDKAIAFFERVAETYGVSPEQQLAIDDVTKEWLQARSDIKAAIDIWDQADRREADAWTKLADMRHRVTQRDEPNE